MKTPEEKYLTDPEYRAMVDALTNYIDKKKFTPSEMREMVMLACIRFEIMNCKNRVYKESE